MKNVGFVILLFLLVACHNGRKETGSFDEKILLTGKVYEKDIISMVPIHFKLIDTTFFLLGPDRQSLIKILSEDDASEVGSFGSFGSGPGEFITPYFSSVSIKDSSFCLYDMSLSILRKYKWFRQNGVFTFNNVEEVKFNDENTVISFLHKMDNGFSVATILTGQEKPLVLLDRDLKIVKNFGYVPQNKQITDFSFYQGCFASYGNKLVFAMNDIGYIACYEVTSKGEVTKQWEHFVTQPIFSGDSDRFDPELNRTGFYDVQMNNQYIFCAYSGKEMKLMNSGPGALVPETLLVFDLAGRAVKSFKTDKAIGRIAISPEANIVYGAYSRPDVGIVKYDLSDWLKEN